MVVRIGSSAVENLCPQPEHSLRRRTMLAVSRCPLEHSICELASEVLRESITFVASLHLVHTMWAQYHILYWIPTTYCDLIPLQEVKMTKVPRAPRRERLDRVLVSYALLLEHKIRILTKHLHKRRTICERCFKEESHEN